MREHLPRLRSADPPLPLDQHGVPAHRANDRPALPHQAAVSSWTAPEVIVTEQATIQTSSTTDPKILVRIRALLAK